MHNLQRFGTIKDLIFGRVHFVFLGEHLWFPVENIYCPLDSWKAKDYLDNDHLTEVCLFFLVFFSPGLLKCFWNSEEWGGLEICRWRFLSLIRPGPHLSWGTWLPPSPTSGIGRHLLSSTSSPAFQAFSSSLVSFWCWLFFAPYDLRRVHLFLQLDQWHKRAQCRYATEGTNYPPGFVFNLLHTMQCVQIFPFSWIICWIICWNWTPQPAIILLVLPSLTFYGAAACIFTPQLSDILSQTESEDRSIAEPVTDSLTE